MPRARVMGRGHRQRSAEALLAARDPRRLAGRTCMAAKEPAEETPTEETGRPARDGSASPPGASPSPEKPLLMVDIDGGISLFLGFAGHAPWAKVPPGPDGCRYETIDGIPHCLSRTAAAHLLELTAEFEPVWASGWEEKAEENLPRLLGLPAGLPFLRFERSPGRGNAHWKLAAIQEHAGSPPPGRGRGAGAAPPAPPVRGRPPPPPCSSRPCPSTASRRGRHRG